MELNRKKNPSLKSRENKESLRLDPLEPWVRDSLTFCLIPYKEFRSQPTECLWKKKKNQFQCKFAWNLSSYWYTWKNVPCDHSFYRRIEIRPGDGWGDKPLPEKFPGILFRSLDHALLAWPSDIDQMCLLLPGPIAASLITATNHLLRGPLCELPHQLPAHTLDCGSRS